VTVGRDDEASGHVVADQRDRRSVSAVAHRQGAPSARSILGIGERRLRAEGDVRQVDAAARESLRWPERDTAPIRNRRIDDLNIPLAVPPERTSTMPLPIWTALPVTAAPPAISTTPPMPLATSAPELTSVPLTLAVPLRA
jgi:hypothetical protein